MIVPDPIIPLDLDDYEYLTADSFPACWYHYDEEPRVWTRELMFEVCGCTGDDTDAETVYLNEVMMLIMIAVLGSLNVRIILQIILIWLGILLINFDV